MADWIESYIEAWNRHDIETVLQFLTPDAVYTDYAIGESHHGHDDIRPFLQSMESDLSSDYRFELVSFFATESRYAYEWIMRGTHDRGTDQLPASGKPLEIHGVAVGTLQQGKIRDHRDYWNMAEFLGQIGMLPAPDAAAAH
jgi:steroid delta-isomerase-like uncharacterized protein